MKPFSYILFTRINDICNEKQIYTSDPILSCTDLASHLNIPSFLIFNTSQCMIQVFTVTVYKWIYIQTIGCFMQVWWL